MDKVYQEYIVALKVLIKLYQENQETSYLKQALVALVRSLEFISDIDVSEKAQNKADELGIGNLNQYVWKDQTKKGKMNDIGRKIFHWEHFYPVQQIINELSTLKELSDENIYRIIRKTKICWILKEENEVLNKIAKSNRPNPEHSYHLANIKLLGMHKRM
jgi:hypothetical protein